MKHIDINTDVRTQSGKGVARKLRQAGRLPGVLYGPGSSPVSLSVDAHDFQIMLQSAKGEQILFHLKMSEGEKEERLAMVKDLQTHPVNDSILHIDFYEVDMDRKLNVEVPVKPVGTPAGVELYQGILEILHRNVTISCLPMNIPDFIEIDVTELNLGESAHVSDITPPEGVEIVDHPELTVASVVGSSSGASSATEEGEEEVEGEEGEVDAEVEEE